VRILCIRCGENLTGEALDSYLMDPSNVCRVRAGMASGIRTNCTSSFWYRILFSGYRPNL